MNKEKRSPSRGKAEWAAYMRRYRAEIETPEQYERRLQKARDAYRNLSEEEREKRREQQRLYMRRRRAKKK